MPTLPAIGYPPGLTRSTRSAKLLLIWDVLMKVRTHNKLTTALLLTILTLVAVQPASAGSLGGRLTRSDDMNAVRFAGQVWTIHDLIDRRDQSPQQFDRVMPRLGKALRLGVDGLDAKRALNSVRFDYYHPIISYLLDDSQADGTTNGLGTLGQPDISPDPTPVSPGQADPVPLLPGQNMPGQPNPGQGGESPAPLPTTPPPPSIVPEPSDGSTPSGPDSPGTPGGELEPPGPGPSNPPPDGPPNGPNSGPIGGAVVPEPPGLVQASIGIAMISGLMFWRRRHGLRPATIA